jgi:chitin synthase
MFLAEDRILCLGIFSLKGNDYTLKYVPNAVARTDAVDSNEEFML